MDDAERYAAFDRLLFDRPAPHVLRVTINNPDKLNALEPDMHRQLETGVGGDRRGPADAGVDRHRRGPRLLLRRQPWTTCRSRRSTAARPSPRASPAPAGW